MSKKGKGKKHILRKIVTAFLLLAVSAGAALYARQALKMKYTVTYDSYTASTGSISNSLSFSGNLAAVNSEIYASPANTSVRTLYAAAGDEVKEGQKLMRLANGAVITAGFDGRVNSLFVAEDDEVLTGDRLIQVADFSRMKISLRVDEYDIDEVEVGDRCTVTVTSNEEKYESSIASIDYISASGGSVAYYTATAYADITGKALPGMQVTVSVPQEEATDVVVLKEDALSFDETNRAYVNMKDDAGELTQVFVETGVSNGNYVEIKSGLADGDEVFVEVKEENESPVTSLLAGLFGQTNFNGARGGSGRNGFSGNMSDFGNMPSGDFGGGMNRGSGSSERSGFGGGGAR